MSKETFNNEGGSTEYFTVSDGQLVKRVKEPTALSRPRTNKNGATVHEERYKSLSGRLVKSELRESQYGKDWSFTIAHEGGRYVVQMPHGSRYATDFAKRFPNIELTAEIKMQPWMLIDEASGKKRAGVSIYQGGQKIEPFYTRDSAEQMPQLKQVKVSGKMVWDSTELDEFVDAILSRVNEGQPTAPQSDDEHFPTMPEGEAPPF
jgi:hypothetical protein